MRIFAEIAGGAVLVAAVLNTAARAQERLPASGTPAVANLPGQPAGEGDLLAVTVYGAPELTRTVRVSAQGSIRLPMLAEAIQVGGLMPEQIEGRLRQALVDAQILVDPVVTVTLAEVASRPVRVTGAVRRPVTFQADARTTLLDALARAEGLAPEAGDHILVTQPAGNGTAPGTVRVPVKELFENADAAANVVLRGGEEVRVPELGRVFVVGNVTKPGSFPLAGTGGMSLLKALALAEGLAPYAAKKAFVYRPAGDKEKQELTVELRKIMDRKHPDVALEAGDILYIPDSRRSRLTSDVINKIVAFASGTASGALVLSTSRR
jgi:polysaccharide export outer membrane protein